MSNPVAKYAFVLPALAVGAPAFAAELPSVCVAGGCGAVTSWTSTPGAASLTQQGDTLTVTQNVDRAILNWASFNISADGKVIFNQPSSTSIALNRIFQDSPSRIFGQLQANGEIYLVNPNGFVFGRTAIVNASGILASTLDISDSTFTTGIAQPVLTAKPALESDGRISVLDKDGNPVRGTIDADGHIVQDPDGEPVTVRMVLQQGAQLATTGDGGRVLLAAREIDNAGSISAPGGQAILAAGDKVYLKANTDPALRGFLVEVDVGGKVWNQLTGSIDTPRGNATLVGALVNQDGRISATTTVNANGSIRLLARDTPLIDLNGGVFSASRTGTLTFGSSSSTTVLPDLADTATAVNDQEQYASRIEGMGHEVTVQSGAVLQASGGEIALSALVSPQGPLQDGTADPTAQLRVESGATIDVSGSSATLPMSRNLVTVELRGNELRDSPDQRDGALRGKTVVVDARVGTPLADVQGNIDAIQRTVAERTAEGGTATLVSDGDIVASPGSTFDVSGGTINYLSGLMATSKLIGADGNLYDIGKADPDTIYVGLINPTYRRVDDRWGQIELIGNNTAFGVVEPGYVEGKSAGTLQFAAPTMVLQGDFLGSTVAGPYQRDQSALPAGGSLLIGLTEGIGIVPPFLDYRAPSVEFVSAATPVAIGAGAQLPAGLTLQLPTDYLGNGFTRTVVNSNGTVTVKAGTPLALAPASTLELNGRNVVIDADITAPAGTLQFTSRDSLVSLGAGATAPGISIGAGVQLDVSGNWSNDFPLPQDVRPVDPVLPDAGSISMTLTTQELVTQPPGELLLGDDVQLRADGGGHIARDGTVTAGAGGDIGLIGSYNSRVAIGDGVGLSAFGLLGASGGTFTLTAPRLSIADGTSWSVEQDAASSDVLAVGTALFSDYGFSSVRLNALGVAGEDTKDIFTVEAGTNLVAQVHARLLDADAATHATGGDVANFSAVLLPLPYQRTAESVSLSAGFSAAVPGANSTQAGDLRVATGAVLRGDAGAEFDFASAGSLFIDGTVVAPSGTIRAGLTTPPQAVDGGYIAGQRVEIGGTAQLDVSGTSILTPNDSGLRTGTVLDAGLISLNTARGGIQVDAGAWLNLAGGSESLDLATQSAAAPYQRQQVGSAGGTLELIAPEAIGLFGLVDAHAGAGTFGAAAGGALRVGLTRNGSFSSSSDAQGTFPTTPRTIDLVAADISLEQLPPDGHASLGSSFITRSGFDSLQLRADGAINIAPGVSLALARQIVLDTPALGIGGAGTVTLEAPYLAIGNSLLTDGPGVSQPGSGVLRLNGEFIDVIGSSALNDVAIAYLHSSGDIRLRGTTRPDGSVRGSLLNAGDLSFAAARIYGSTATQFSLTAEGGTHDGIFFGQTGVSPGTPLSAGSSLTVQARSIEQNGTLLVPFGSISLNGTDSVSFGAGSTTSVSGAGTVVPYGSVAIGDWFYSALAGNTGGVHAGSVDVTALPERRISVSGDTVDIADGASLDLTGGGDLYAYEWEPGPGGSKDALAAGVTPGLYAILPSTQGQYAPIDPQEYVGSDLAPGASVYLSGTADLPAGFYPLLPARYALLPGAMLVRAVPDTAGVAPGLSSTLSDGTPVATGYLTFGNTGLGSSQYSSFEVRRGSYGRELAAYDDYYASSFFTGGVPGSSTADAGALSLFAGSRLDALGNVLTAAAQGGLNAAIDISARNLLVSSATAAAVDQVQVSPTLLAAWNPSRLTLGASIDASGNLAVTADTVTVGAGTDLKLEEIVVAAHDNIAVDSLARIETPSADNATAARLADEATTLRLGTADAGAALLAVSDLRQLLTARDGSAETAGTVDIGNGAVLASGGAITLDTPGGGNLPAGALVLNGANARVALGADHIVLGQLRDAGELLIDSELQTNLQDAAAVRLAGTTIEVRDDVSLDLGAQSGSRIDVLAAQLTDANASGSQVDLTAQTITLAGLNGSTPGEAAAGSGTLHAAADELVLGPDFLTVNGFDRVGLSANTRVLGSGTGGFTTAGDVAIDAPLVEAGTGADTRISAPQGRVSFTNSGTDPIAQQLGGAFGVDAQNIDVATTIAAPSGLVTLTAASDLTLGRGGVIDVSGRAVTAGGRTEDSFGGTVALDAGGALTLAAGSVLDASGSGGAAAGRLSLSASGLATLQGTLAAASADPEAGGYFAIDARGIADAPALLGALAAGGFTSAQQLHVQDGDLDVGANQQVSARTVELVTEIGTVSVNGAIDARGSDSRGSIRLYGGSGVDLRAGGSLVTDATGTGTHGGDIEIGVGNGGTVDLASGSTVSAHGAADSGDFIVRTPLADGATDLPVAELASNFTGIGAIQLAPVFEVGTTDDSVTAASFTPAVTAAGAFVDGNGAAILGRLANATTPAMSIRPEIELLHEGDLQVGALNPGSWRFGGLPGTLSIRATGSLTLAGLISDGYSSNTTSPARLDLVADPSSSLRLVGGADLASIDPTRLGAADSGDLVFAANTIVRTGTGDLFLGAARDVVFNTGSTAFISGSSGAATPLTRGYNGAVTFPDRGGSLRLRAGRDVLGSPVTQSASNWQIRTTRANLSSAFSKFYGIDVGAFRWNLGALGGGDLDVQAGGSIHDLSAAAAASQLVDDAGQLHTFGGGSMAIAARGDVDTALLFGDAGTLRVRADGSIGSDRLDASGTVPLRSLLELGAERVLLQARGDVELESAMNSTVLRSTGVSNNSESGFFTYGDTASLTLASGGGSIRLGAGLSAGSFLESGVALNSGGPDTLALYPATLRAAAYAGDIVLDGGALFTLFPSDTGQLDLFASHDVASLLEGSGIVMSDGDASAIPTVFAPVPRANSYSEAFKAWSSARHGQDPVPAQISAGNDIAGLILMLAKQARIVADRDIADVSMDGQNLNAGDLTLVSAGRDVTFATGSDAGGFVLSGPGRLDVLAGRDVNLGFVRNGIATLGRLRNPAIVGDTGADVTVIAGLAGGVDYAGFIDTVIAKTDAYDSQLIAFVASVEGGSPSAAQALAALKAMSDEQRRPFVDAVFMAELVGAGRDANAAVPDAFERGYAAIDALFPQSGAVSGDGANNHYTGDVNMAFSRIYTLSGGNITVLVPGGEMNVGLAMPPPTVAARLPSELGVVAQGTGSVNIFTAKDVLVNSSRIFTLLGGNIAVWSTLGNIDAGRGAKTSLSSPPPTVVIDANGKVTLDFRGAVAGSGIRTIATSEDVNPGDVDLIAPVGFVNAGDAGIGAAGNLNIAARQVVGLDNIQVGLGATGVPTEVGGLGASLSGVSSVGSGASSSATSAVSDAANAAKEQAPLAQAALSWLDVFVLGLGEENCKLDDADCIKRQKQP